MQVTSWKEKDSSSERISDGTLVNTFYSDSMWCSKVPVDSSFVYYTTQKGPSLSMDDRETFCTDSYSGVVYNSSSM